MNPISEQPVRRWSDTVVTAGTSAMVFHNLGTRDVIVAVYDYVGRALAVPLEVVDDNTIRFELTHPSEFRVVVIG